MKKGKVVFFVFLLIMGVVSCIPNTNNSIKITAEELNYTITPSISLTYTVGSTKVVEAKKTEYIFTSSPYPTFPHTYMPDVEYIEKWQEFQVALAGKLISHVPSENALCEWKILGETNTDIYAWAICKGYFMAGEVEKVELLAGASVPVVIHINENGVIEQVELPKSGNLYSQSIREMFPDDIENIIIQKQIDYQKFGDHLDWRLEHPEEPPLIVVEATSMP